MKRQIIILVFSFAFFFVSAPIYMIIARHAGEAKKLSQIIDAMAKTDAAFYIVNDRSECEFVTDGLCDLVGLEEGGLLGKNTHDILHHHYPDGTIYPFEECEILQAMQLRKTIANSDDVVWHQNGEMIPCSWTSVPFKANGEMFTRITIYPKSLTGKQPEY